MNGLRLHARQLGHALRRAPRRRRQKYRLAFFHQNADNRVQRRRFACARATRQNQKTLFQRRADRILLQFGVLDALRALNFRNFPVDARNGFRRVGQHHMDAVGAVHLAAVLLRQKHEVTPVKILVHRLKRLAQLK